ncbi:hypothetical protein [Kitasatospora cineracea]|uniref:hypothetical protein n=1 Tax=Kitasatospora cineracea TaxID=88074 RepID=UPI0037BC1F5A
MGRRVLGAIAVGREVLLVAALDVTGNPHLSGRTVAAAHRPGAWRVLALDLADPDRRSPDLADPYTTTAPELRWNPDPDRLLTDGDRVVVATTREGLGHLTTGTVGPAPAPDDGPADPGPSAGARRSPLPRPTGPAS